MFIFFFSFSGFDSKRSQKCQAWLMMILVMLKVTNIATVVMVWTRHVKESLIPPSLFRSSASQASFSKYKNKTKKK